MQVFLNSKASRTKDDREKYYYFEEYGFLSPCNGKTYELIDPVINMRRMCLKGITTNFKWATIPRLIGTEETLKLRMHYVRTSAPFNEGDIELEFLPGRNYKTIEDLIQWVNDRLDFENFPVNLEWTDNTWVSTKALFLNIEIEVYWGESPFIAALFGYPAETLVLESIGTPVTHTADYRPDFVHGVLALYLEVFPINDQENTIQNFGRNKSILWKIPYFPESRDVRKYAHWDEYMNYEPQEAFWFEFEQPLSLDSLKINFYVMSEGGELYQFADNNSNFALEFVLDTEKSMKQKLYNESFI